MLRSVGWAGWAGLLLLGSAMSLPAAEQATRVSAPATARAMSINMEDVTYPHPVQYLELNLYNNDIRMAYMDVPAAGTANGRSVVLLHGMNWFGEYFATTIAKLTAQGYRVVVPDQVGFGRSSKPIMTYSLNDHVANTKALLDELGIERAAIVGHSMGGMIATRFASAHPKLTSHLVIVNQIGLTDARGERGFTRLEDSYRSNLRRDYPAVRRNYERYFVKWDPAYERYVDMAYGWTLSSEWPRLAMVRALNQQWVYADPVVYDRPRIKAKTLFLSGAEDGANFRTLAQQVVAGIPGAKLNLIEQAGHCPHLEAPDKFFPPLLQFLADR